MNEININPNGPIEKEKRHAYSEEIDQIKMYIEPEDSEKLNFTDAYNYINSLEIPADDKLFLKITMIRSLEIRKFSKLADKVLKEVVKENKELKDSFINWEISKFYKHRTLLKNKRK